ncbi:hypothetical protein WJX84_009139 [Apatococcus fuscideae]|uniref:Uncharacterized protein n=1 Tax=Apatococcus fuscideae TaxID=2026836 RepID=A0AAW1STB7_9CHLO
MPDSEDLSKQRRPSETVQSIKKFWPAGCLVLAVLLVAFFSGHGHLHTQLGSQILASVDVCTPGQARSGAWAATLSNLSSLEQVYRIRTKQTCPFETAFERQQQNLPPAVAVLTIVQESIGWGRDRDFWDFMSMLGGLSHDTTTFTLSMSIESEVEFHRVACTLATAYRLADDPGLKCAEADPYFTQKEKPPPLLSVQLFHVPQLEGGDKHEALKQAEQKDERGPKKVPQKHAKRWVARTRNRLASVAFASESALLWLDSDLESVHSDMVTAMLRSDKDIAVPIVRCQGQDGPDYYDQNTWIGPLRPDFLPREQESFRNDDMDWAGSKASANKEGRWGHQLHFLDDGRYQEEAYVKVDSVGSSVLFMRPYVFQQGATFGVANLVGADWEREGWDCIESESLCWLATKMGFECWGMPQLEAWHGACPG